MAFTLQHPDATLNDKQIESAMGRILARFNRSVPAFAKHEITSFSIRPSRFPTCITA